MKFPLAMLKDLVRTDLGVEAVGDLLTMAGFELEGIETVEGEPVLDVKVMSNRGDGLSVFGLSREVLAKDPNAEPTELFLAAAARFEDAATPGTLTLATDAAAVASEGCRRFVVRAFERVPAGDAAPEWIQARLRQAGMRPISLVVDLTNYVMLELGQPLHAFDRDRLRGGRLVVRHAQPGERLTTLNGVEHALSGQMMICDAERPVGVPGVMGGIETEVTEATTRVLLESANFVNTTVRATRKALGLNTEASYRFERSVDPDLAVAAVHRFTALLLQAAPGVTVSNVVDHYPGRTSRTSIALHTERCARLLGMNVTDREVQRYLERLGMEVAGHGNPFEVVPPSWRPDLVREEDLIEEVGRVHGYDRIPERLPEGRTTLGGPWGMLRWVDTLREAVVRAGFVQTISHSLRDAHPLDGTDLERLGPRNPASPEAALLRNSVLPSLADAAARNGGRDLTLFEIGQVFGREGGEYREFPRLGYLLQGGGADFFALKGAVVGTLAACAVPVACEAPPDGRRDLRLHPTRQALLVGLRNDQPIGFLGQIHPDAAAELGLPEDTLLAEVMLRIAYAGVEATPALRPISRNPAVRRDIALLLDKSVPYAQVEATVAKAGGEVLERQWLFDVFEGTGIPAGKHSLGIALQLRKVGENFTDEEANQVRERVVAALADLGGTTR